MNSIKNSRRYDLDWMKVIVTLFVFLYHCSMFFNPFSWHVKNNTIDSGFILVFSLVVGTWIMPLFFVLSGLSTSYSLQKRGGLVYLKERFIRLGIPLLFGIFILSPPQVYIERLTHGQFSGSFLSFVPHYFDGLYLGIGGSGNFAFVGLHLWYLLALLLFSIITLPLFLKTKPIKVPTTSSILVTQIPIILVATFSNIVNLGGWDLLVYLLLYLIGYYFFTNYSIDRLKRKLFLTLIFVWFISTCSYIIWFYIGAPSKGTLTYFFFTALLVISCWNLILCISYLAHKYLSFQNNILKYCSEAAMPFYVLHQPIIVFLGFYLKDLDWPVGVKFVLLIMFSFTIIILTYHFIIRRISFLRVLFGLKS
ncbi:acyltransferase family protein [Metabacillus litoralis]|uniref:acyltransferase family protein n=1 Tax=Metabacillus litoralis TaxID=152268 RepID=UPI001CFED094|nr:acyltransferase family protein [Metabacillus litoralis]